MWIYQQSTGKLIGTLHSWNGYAGHGPGKNNPDMQDMHCVGPLPRGFYTIGEPHDTETHGPCVLALTPDPGQELFGRSGFLVHGDSMGHPGEASQGCIVVPMVARIGLWHSGDRRLEVTR